MRAKKKKISRKQQIPNENNAATNKNNVKTWTRKKKCLHALKMKLLKSLRNYSDIPFYKVILIRSFVVSVLCLKYPVCKTVHSSVTPDAV